MLLHFLADATSGTCALGQFVPSFFGRRKPWDFPVTFNWPKNVWLSRPSKNVESTKTQGFLESLIFLESLMVSIWTIPTGLSFGLSYDGLSFHLIVSLVWKPQRLWLQLWVRPQRSCIQWTSPKNTQAKTTFTADSTIITLPNVPWNLKIAPHSGSWK